MRLCPECMKPMWKETGYVICKVCRHYLNLRTGRPGVRNFPKDKRVARWRKP